MTITVQKAENLILKNKLQNAYAGIEKNLHHNLVCILKVKNFYKDRESTKYRRFFSVAFKNIWQYASTSKLPTDF